MSEAWAIVVAAGRGERFGGDKVYAEIGGKTLVDHALARANRCCDGTVLVTTAERADEATAADRVVVGGETRAASVRAGLAVVPEQADVVIVHDAARPLAPETVFERVIAAVRAGADCAVPGLALVDTIKEVDGDRVLKTLDRNGLVAVQTPQAFRREVLVAAHASGGDATDDAGLVEASNHNVVVVAGDRAAAKVTTADDVRTLEAELVEASRIGHGFDSHAFSDDTARPLMLGGVRFDGASGLAGHSDADVVAHALIDALLGGAGLGDIGQQFPDSDPAYAGADSMELLRIAAGLVSDRGFALRNADCTVVLDQPKVAPHRAEMETNLSAAAGGPVSVKAKTTEGLTGVDGAACWAVALLGPT